MSRDYIYDFSTGGDNPSAIDIDITASDELTTITTTQGNTYSGYAVTGISGTYLGSAITGLTGPVVPYSAGAPFPTPTDNFIFASDSDGVNGSTDGIDFDGIDFLVENRGQHNLFTSDGNYNYVYQYSRFEYRNSESLQLIRFANAFSVDGSQGVQSLTGTGSPNFINTSGAAGAGDVAVDLAAGTVTKGGQLDATFTNIQGVQLGADVSAILGLTGGTDLLYGGTGPDTFNGNGATDYIQGGTGTNIVQGGSGNEVFYGNGGNDVMRGGSAANFMSGGSIPSSTDVFYGTTGNDFVYANGGAVDLVGGSGNEFLSAGSGFNELDDRNQNTAQGAGTSALVGSTGNDLFYAGIGVNVVYEGSGTDTFVGGSGTDQIYGGAGRSFTYAGSGTDVVTTGAGNDYIQAGSGALSFNDTAANLHAGRFDEIDGFSGSKSTDLYLPTADQGATRFVSQNGGTAVLTSVGGGTAEIFASNTDVATVQGHTHFTL